MSSARGVRRPNASNKSFKKLTAAILATSPLVFVASIAHADSLIWDPAMNGSTSGGNGTWDLSTVNWLGSGGEVAWTDTVGFTDSASFFNTPGNVVLNDTLGAASLNFNVAGYSITGTGTISTQLINAGSITGTTAIGVNLNLLNGQTWTVGNGATLTVDGHISGTGPLTFSGGGTTILTNTNSYSGSTLVTAGTVQVGVDASSPDNILPTTSGVILNVNGGTTPVTFDVRDNQRIGSLGVVNNNGTQNTINIASGKTLTVGYPSASGGDGGGQGKINLGTNGNNADTTKVTFSGGGNLVMNGGGDGVTNGGAFVSFVVGSNVSTGTHDSVTVDMRGLNSFTGLIGTFRIGDANTANLTNTNGSTIFLPTNSQITAGRMDTESGPIGATDKIKLGSGVNHFNFVDSFLGAGAILNGRSNGEISFSGTSGTLVWRGFFDNVPGNLTMVSYATIPTNGVTTSATPTAVFDVAEHQTDLWFGNLAMAGRRSANTAGATATMNFGGTSSAGQASTMTVSGSLMMSWRAHASGGPNNGVITSTLNLLGGTASLNNIVMGYNDSTGTTGVLNSTINISGNANVGMNTVAMAVTGSGTNGAQAGTANAAINISSGTLVINSLSMASATSAAAVANTALNITGGSVTLNSDLIRAGGVGHENTTLTLNGGALDMAGHNIGSAAAGIGSGTGALNFQSGTLQNVNEINGGTTALIKSNAGTNVTTLLLAGTNNYTGGTIVNGGVLQVAATSNPGASGGSLNVADNAALQLLPGTSAVTRTFGGINLNSAGNMDVGNSSFLTSTPISTLQPYLATGFNGGNWNGSAGARITSVSAAASGLQRGLGYASDTDVTAGRVATNNASIGVGQTLVKYTTPGDADLSGGTNFNDFLALQNNFNKAGNWTQGDFDYNGTTNFNDFLILQNNFNRGLNANGTVAHSAVSKLTASPAAVTPSVTYILSKNDDGKGNLTPGKYAVYAVDSSADGNQGVASFSVDVQGASLVTNFAPQGTFDKGQGNGSTVVEGFTLLRSVSGAFSTGTDPVKGSQDTVDDQSGVVLIYGMGQVAGNLNTKAPSGSTGGSAKVQASYGSPLLISTGTFASGLAFNSDQTFDKANVFLTNTAADTEAAGITLVTQDLSVGVPEPTTLGVIALGAGSLLGRRKRRK